MSVFLHFSNLAPSAKKASLLSINSDAHIFTRNETMNAFVEHYGEAKRTSWGYHFSLVIITDRTKEELGYLLDAVELTPMPDGYVNKYTFVEPDYGTEDYWTMRSEGQISLTFSEFEKYIRLT